MMHRCSMTITTVCRVRSCSKRTSHHPRPIPPGARPQRISTPSPSTTPTERLTLHQARADIRQQVAAHAQHNEGILVLGHPPGTGKGFNTITGLKDYLRADPDPGFIVWTSLRKAQIADQDGLSFIPLHGRHAGNCRKLPEALELGRKGYSIRDVLCTRRCPHLARCTYMRQFDQEGDFFAAMPLLQATHWWRDAGVVVLDEFDPSQLTRIVQLTSADLAAMTRAHGCPHAKAVVRWLATVLASTTERSLAGALLYQELTCPRCCACWIANSGNACPGSVLPAASKRASVICCCTSVWSI
jgi:hypothetical protein